MVQEVWFRKFTQIKAIELNINGFVKNTTDGNVYIEAEGVENNLEEFTKWLYKGSPLSVVRNVYKEQGEVKGYKDFSIRY